MRKARKPQISIDLFPPHQQPRDRTRSRVLADGALIGFLEKIEDTATETHPWKAFRPRFVAGSPAQFGDMVGAYYGGQSQAIAALVKADS
jgi:hypothetical protein